MVDTVYSRVGHSLRTGRFPLLYGADCTVLLAAIPALRDTAGRAGLLFVDAVDRNAGQVPDAGGGGQRASAHDRDLVIPVILVVVFVILGCCCGRWWRR